MQVPFIPTQQDLNDARVQLADSNSFGLGSKLPMFGTDRPEGWERVRISQVWGEGHRGVCRDNTFLVDMSGYGKRDEPALTIEEFIEALRPGLGYAVVGVGQFQLKVGVFCERGSSTKH